MCTFNMIDWSHYLVKFTSNHGLYLTQFIGVYTCVEVSAVRAGERKFIKAWMWIGTNRQLGRALLSNNGGVHTNAARIAARIAAQCGVYIDAPYITAARYCV